MISAWWILAYGLYHVVWSGVLMGWVSRREITDALCPAPGETWIGNGGKLLGALVMSSFNVLVSGFCVYRFSEYQSELPPESFGVWLKQLVWCALWADIWFYTTHRLLHWPVLYRHIHSWHHRWHRPLPWVTYDAHPLEHLLTNTGSILVPLMLVGPTSSLLVHSWVLLVITQATWSHAGPWPWSPHERHHTHFQVHYGLSLFMDRWLQTQDEQ